MVKVKVCQRICEEHKHHTAIWIEKYTESASSVSILSISFQFTQKSYSAFDSKTKRERITGKTC